MMGSKLAVSLFVKRGKNEGHSFGFDTQRISIGRDLANDFSIVDEEVSRWHCAIQVNGDELELADLESSNGTFVNEMRIGTRKLKSGDLIRVGQTLLLVSSEAKTLVPPDHSTSDFLSHETNYIDQEGLDTCVMPLTDQTLIDSDSSGEVFQTAGRRFVRIQNDLKFVYETSLATSRKVDMLKMLEELLDLIFGWIAPDRGCVFLSQPESETPVIRIVKNLLAGPDKHIQVCDSIVDYVIEQKVGVLSHDPGDDIRKSDPSFPVPPISEVMCVPIQARGKLHGLFYVDTLVDPSSKKINRFTKDHLRLLLSMAHQAAVVIENDTTLEALVEKERLAAVGETTALLSHQVNNILQGISGGRHLLEMGLNNGDIEMAREGWVVVERNQARISKMMLDLVFLSKPYEPKRTATDITQVVQATVNQVAEANETDVEFGFECADDVPGCELDVAVFEGSLNGLLKLIAKSCDTQGVHLYVTSDDEALRLNVDYAGAEIYMTTDHAEQDFCDGSRRFGGIEMALFQKVVMGHGGTLKVVSLDSAKTRLAISIPHFESSQND